jgi:hypothetical protein
MLKINAKDKILFTFAFAPYCSLQKLIVAVGFFLKLI